MVTRRTLVPLIAGAVVLIVGGYESSVIPTYAQLCETNQQTHAKNCSTYHSALVALWHIAKFLEDHSGAITALATAAMGYFTYTLKQSTDRLWKASEQQLKATHRPWASVESINVAGPLTFNDGEGSVPLVVALKNLGHSPAVRVSVHVKLILSNTINPLEAQKEYSAHFRKTPLPNEIRPELTLWPGDHLVFPVTAWVNSNELPKYKDWAGRTPFPIALLAVIGCIDYEFTFAEGHHQTGLIYDLHKASPYPQSQFGSTYSHIPGAVLLDGTIPASDLTLKLNIVGTGSID